jgi:microcompartment protein CcmL/EutN
MVRGDVAAVKARHRCGSGGGAPGGRTDRRARDPRPHQSLEDILPIGKTQNAAAGK